VIAGTFILLPVLALFLRTSPGDLFTAATSADARAALLVSLKTSVIAHVFILLIGTPTAYLLATRTFRGRSWLIGLIELPLVLPPAVAGLALLYTFGRLGLLGRSLDAAGVSIAFTQTAVVMAIVFVASPFYVRQAIAAFQAVDPNLTDAARTLGASQSRVFGRVAIPLALGGLGAGSALAWARGLGEFGATIMFAGSFEGVTRTLPLAIYSEFDRDPAIATAIAVMLVIASATILIAVKVLPWKRSQSISVFPFATSRSS
jgi:molybdate transport system permease protein